MKVLIDTNVYSEWKRGHSGVAELIRNAEHVFVSTVVLGELLFGFRCGNRLRRNQAELEEFLASPYVHLLPVTYTTADRFSRVAASLKKSGQPIPTNDAWIAASALETGADLVSFDQHFDVVEGLSWIDPAR